MVMLHEDKNTCGLVSTVSADLSARFLQTQSLGTRLGLKIAHQSWFRPIASLIEHATIPGMLRHYALRKRVLRQMAQEALGHGIQQSVILGAGFDTLAFELSRECAGVRFWEIDHPATQMQKIRCLTSIENVRFVAADLSDNAFPATALKTSDFDPAQPTLWIAEGLLMYFREDTVTRLGRIDPSAKRIRQCLCLYIHENGNRSACPFSKTNEASRLVVALARRAFSVGVVA